MMIHPPILHADVRGSGPVVVLLHGFLSSSRYWRQLVDVLQTNHTVVALDLLGFGSSPKPRRSKYGYDEHIASINATLDSLGIDQPFILVGHSMGSLIALRYSTQYPERIDKQVLTNMPVMLGRKQVRDEILQTSLLYKLGLQSYTHRLTWPVFRSLYRLGLLPKRTSESLKRNSYFFQHNASSRIQSFQKVIGDARADIDLKVVRVKTLVVSGVEDRKVYLDNLTQNITLSPSVTLENVTTGHHIPCVMPGVLAEKLNAR
jgi:pimeloyl-ACP methyl ester carboxylesterase